MAMVDDPADDVTPCPFCTLCPGLCDDCAARLGADPDDDWPDDDGGEADWLREEDIL
jgi:hypothetical protein